MTGPLKAKEKAGSLVPQINETHAKLVSADTDGFRQSLTLAIELGVLPKLAKEAVYHGHWESWFEGQGFKFSYRSANRYMRLAENREKLEEEAANSPRVADLAAQGELSIRAADALLRPVKTAAALAAEKAEREAKAAARKAEREVAASAKRRELTDPDAIIGEIEADDVAEIIERKWDRDKQDQLLVDQLKRVPPSRLVDLVIEAYRNENELKALGEGIASRLRAGLSPALVAKTQEAFRPTA
jgi:hypothetical protein